MGGNIAINKLLSSTDNLKSPLSGRGSRGSFFPKFIPQNKVDALLDKADLTGADLIGVDATEITFIDGLAIGANVTEANFMDSILINSNFTDAIGIETANFEGADTTDAIIPGVTV